MQLIAGNWKMNGTRASLAELELLAAWAGPAKLVICPPATLLMAAADRLAGTAVAVGAQDCSAHPPGARTGEIAAVQLADAGATHVIVGHSERRQHHGEADTQVRAKADAALAAGLKPIVCVGETLGEREAGRTLDVVLGQVAASVPDQADLIAYEPVWAIGSGLTPTPAEVAEVHAAIAAARPDAVILYGGSVKPDNAATLLAVAHVGGALVGGASLKAADFLAIAGAVRP